MKKLKVFAFGTFILLSTNVFGQDPSVLEMKSTASKNIQTITDTAFTKGWRKGGLVNISLTQIGNSNWVAAGGDKFSLSFSGTLNAFATKKWDKATWDNVLDINYGLVNTTTLGVRKVNDLLSFLSKLGYAPDHWKNTNVSLVGQFRSQLTDGFDYNYFGTGQKRRNSGFFAPAYITIAPGIDWHPKPWLSIFGSPVSLRWTIVSNGPYSYAGQGGIFQGHQETALATLYGVDPAKENRAEVGAFVTVTAKKDVTKDISYAGKLDLYSNYLKNPQNVDVFWTNLFLLKVNKWLSVTYEIDLLYDDDIKQSANPTRSVGLQVLSTFGIGVSAKF